MGADRAPGTTSASILAAAAATGAALVVPLEWGPGAVAVAAGTGLVGAGLGWLGAAVVRVVRRWGWVREEPGLRLLRRICAAAVEVRVRAVRHTEVDEVMRMTTAMVETGFRLTRVALRESGPKQSRAVDALDRAAVTMELVARTLDDRPHTRDLALFELKRRLDQLLGELESPRLP